VTISTVMPLSDGCPVEMPMRLGMSAISFSHRQTLADTLYDRRHFLAAMVMNGTGGRLSAMEAGRAAARR